MILRVISRKMVKEYYEINTQSKLPSKLPLIEWYFKVNHSKINNLIELRNIFNSVDSVHGYTVFNIGSNNYRLITAIHYNTQTCYVRALWTLAEYSKRDSQLKLKRGDL